MANKSSNDSTPLNLCTVPEIIKHLSERVPALAIAVLAMEEDGVNSQTCSTLALTSGNRAACLGLANLLHERTLRDLMTQQEDMDTETKEDDDERPHRAHG